MGKMMKTVLSKLRRDETGQAFILVLILLILGGLIIAPLLGFMGTGLIAGQLNEKRMAELYAADAGVEDALWNIMDKNENLPTQPNEEWELLMGDNVNGKVVYPIVITYIDETTYRINSTATTDASSRTTIESYINILSFADFMDNAITSTGTVDLKSEGENKAMVYDGDVVYCTGDPPSEEQVIAGDKGIDGEVRHECVEGWPTAEQLHDYYWPDVESSEPFPYPDGTVIDVKDTDTIGPLYCEGDLDIKCTNEDEVAQLHHVEGNGIEEEFGTVYVKGDLKIAGPKDFTLNLNYQTIFVEGDIDIGDSCTITGSGCIVALGNIFFSPKFESSPDDFVFVMSVYGWLQFNPGAPSSDFYGSLAGDVDVQLKPGKSLNWTGPPPELKFPGAEPSTRNVIAAIRTWEIDTQ